MGHPKRAFMRDDLVFSGFNWGHPIVLLVTIECSSKPLLPHETR